MSGPVGSARGSSTVSLLFGRVFREARRQRRSRFRVIGSIGSGLVGARALVVNFKGAIQWNPSSAVRMQPGAQEARLVAEDPQERRVEAKPFAAAAVVVA